MAVLFTVRGRGRLVLRWERAASNPRRVTIPVHEQVRRNLVDEVGAGRLSPEAAEARFERFLRRYGGTLT